MKEYCKNGNEYILDGKRYIEDIKSCSIIRKCGDCYHADCNIHQRGTRSYTFNEDCTFLCEYGTNGTKGFWLSNNLVLRLKETVKDFNENIESIKEKSYSFCIDEVGIGCWFLKNEDESYTMMVESLDVNGKTIIDIYDAENFMMMERKFRFDTKLSRSCAGAPEKQRRIEEILNEIYEPETRDALFRSPFYEYAVKTEDETLQLCLLLHKNLINREECERFSELIGARVLPPFPEGNKQEYYIRSGDYDMSLMCRSGYQILHCPYPGMRGKTHEALTFKPYSRTITDAAPADCEITEFEDFIRLFDV